MPLSTLIPALSFPDPDSHTGLLDLYVVFLQTLGRASSHGPTPAQVIACCSALLCHVISRVEETLDSPVNIDDILERHKGSLPDLSPEELIERGKASVRASLQKLQAAQLLIQELQDSWFRHMRAVEALAAKGLIPGGPAPTPQQMLISDEIVTSLGLDRDQLEVGLGIRG